MKKFKSIFKVLMLFVITVIGFSSCDDDEVVFKELTPAGEIEETVWDGNTTVYISSDVVVAEGKSLTIAAGAKVIFTGDNLGTDAAPEFQVRGKLFIEGTTNNPVQFTVEAENQTLANRYLGLWGGIQCAASCTEIAIEGLNLNYAGAVAGASSIFVEQGEDEGDPRYGIFFGNVDGKFVLHNSQIINTADDAMRIVGGKVSICNNTFAYIGETGGEAINIKSGVKGDMAFNTFYNCATNGTKWSNSGDLSPQTECNSYNNTFVNCGWRRNKEGRGGSVNIEKEGRGSSYNQLIVNCKYGVRVVGGEDAADSANVNSDFTYYFANEQLMVDEFYPTHGILPYLQNKCGNDIDGAVNANNPLFEVYDVSTQKSTDLELKDLDFHLKTGSPALSGAKTDFSPILSSLTVGSKTFTTPAPADYFGANGTK